MSICFLISVLFLEWRHNEMLLDYVCVRSELEDESTEVSAVELKHFIITGLKSLFGEVRPWKTSVWVSFFFFFFTVCCYFTTCLYALWPPGGSSVGLWCFKIQRRHPHSISARAQSVSRGGSKCSLILSETRSAYHTCFQGFGEPVELFDSAGLLPEPGLRLQSPAG